MTSKHYHVTTPAIGNILTGSTSQPWLQWATRGLKESVFFLTPDVTGVPSFGLQLLDVVVCLWLGLAPLFADDCTDDLLHVGRHVASVSTHVYMSTLFQQLPDSFLLLGHEVLYILLLPRFPGEGHKDRRQRLVVQIALDLVLVDVVVVAIATAKEQNSFPENFSCGEIKRTKWLLEWKDFNLRISRQC